MALFASDDFTGADGTELTAYNAAFTKTDTNTQQIASGRLRLTSTGGSPYWHSATPGAADYEASVDIYVASTLTGFGAGPTLRHSSSAATFYHSRLLSGTNAFQLFRVVTNTFTQLGSNVAQSLSVGATHNLKLKAVGSTIEVFRDGGATAVISVSDGNITAAGHAGLRNTQSTHTPTDTNGLHIDTFRAEDYTSAGTPVGLAVENDTALALGIGAPVGLAAELDTALALPSAGAIGLATETDTALGLAAVQSMSVGLATETDIALGGIPTEAPRLASGGRGSRYAVQIDRKWYFFNDPKDIEELLSQEAEEEAEAIRKPRPKARIVVKPGVVNRIAQQAAQQVPAQATHQQVERAQHAVRQMYRLAYAKAMQAIEQDEEDALMVLL